MRTSTEISRPANMPIRNWLNLVLVVSVFASAVVLLWLASQAMTGGIIFTVGICFSYLLLTNYALLHEATHDNLNENLNWNYGLGMCVGILFPVPFTMVRLTHQGHHQRNRTDAEMFDLYYATDNRLYKYWIWYSTLSGWFWPLIPLGATLLAILPAPLYNRLFTAPPWRNPSLCRLTVRERWQIRLETLAIALCWASMFWLLNLKWLHIAVLYACFAFNWSTRQYVAHAFTRRDVIEGAWNLKHNWFMNKVLLNGNWDLNHHRRPDISWYYLPRLSPPDEIRPNYIWQYWSQWLGPRLTTEPSPDTKQ